VTCRTVERCQREEGRRQKRELDKLRFSNENHLNGKRIKDKKRFRVFIFAPSYQYPRPFIHLTKSARERDRETAREREKWTQRTRARVFLFTLSPAALHLSLSYILLRTFHPHCLDSPPANRQEKVLLVSPRSSCYGLSLPHWTILSSVPKKHHSLSLSEIRIF
jgi:hypothetical protein